MTNLDKWRFAHKHVTSPDTWVDASWLFAVTSALQRRVWFRSLKADPLFCNLYFVLIGPPACGKGLAMSQLKRVMFQPRRLEDTEAFFKGSTVPLLLNKGPDDGSHQGLMDCMAKATLACKLHDGDRERLYSHTSVALVLSEMNSLFKRHQDAVAKFLLKTYDCEDYEYEIVSRCQKLTLRNTCLSMVAGCTSHMLEEAAKFGIFDSGFVSRCLFMFEPRPRYYTLDLPEMTAEQSRIVDELATWIRRLAGVNGKLTVGAGVAEFLAARNVDYETKIKSSNAQLQLFYGRYGVLLRKLAAAFHFSESLATEVQLPAFEQAYEWLQPIEKRMAVGFAVTGKNGLNFVAQALVAVLRNNRRTALPEGALFAAVMNDCSYKDFKEVLQGLLATGMVGAVPEGYKLLTDDQQT